jgi:hypothetical protein
MAEVSIGPDKPTLTWAQETCPVWRANQASRITSRLALTGRISQVTKDLSASTYFARRKPTKWREDSGIHSFLGGRHRRDRS